MPGRARAAASLVIVLVPSLAVSWPAAASSVLQVASERRVVVILLDRVTPAMVSNITSVQGLVARGAAGLMVTTTGPGGGGDGSLAPATTLSAGEAAVAPAPGEAGRSVQPGAVHEETDLGSILGLYRARTGEAPGVVNLLYPDIGLLARLNAAATVGATPGLLGETLRRAGIDTAAVGTSDLPDDPLRPAPILAMDGIGRVRAGSAATDMDQLDQPLPIAVDPDAIQGQTADALREAQLVVVDWGDTSRIDRLFVELAGRLEERDASGRTLRARLEQARSTTLRRFSEFVTFVGDQLVTDRDIVVVVTPSPPSDQQDAGVDLATIVVSGGGTLHGSLTSSTTRRTGLVGSIDLAPSILNWFRVPIPSEMEGHIMEVRTGIELPLRDAQDHLRSMSNLDRQRTSLLMAGLVLWLLAVGLTVWHVERHLRDLARSLGGSARRPAGRAGSSRTTVVRGGRSRRRRAARARARPHPGGEPLILLRALLFSAGFLPIALLLVPDFGSPVISVLVTIVVALALGLAWALGGRERTAAALGTIGVFTVLVLLADRLLGSHPSYGSALGVQAWEGLRLHGLGPLLAGVAVAGVIIAAGALVRRFRREPGPRWATLGISAAALLVLSLPGLGGSLVVGITGLVALVVLAAMVAGRPPAERLRQVGAASVAAGLMVAGALVLAGEVTDATSVSSAVADGPAPPAALAAILLRQSSGAARLLFASVWTVVIAASGAALAFVVVRMRRGPWAGATRGKGLPAEDRHVQATVASIVVAAALALVTSPAGAATAGLLLMAGALLAAGSALDRVRALRARAA